MLIAVLMLVASVSAFAADPVGSITVTGKKVAEGETETTYEAYRIFDVAVSTDEGGNAVMDESGNKFASMTYTINSNWTGFFTSPAAGADYIVTDNVTSANSGKGYTPIVVGGVRKYIALTDANVATFAKAAFDWSQKNNVAADYSNNTGVFTDLPLGYYMVYPKGANINVGDYTSIVSLTTTNQNVEVAQKAEYPTLEKVDDDESVELGQTVNYTLTSKVPDTTGYETFTFNMHDQMTDGLTFDGASSITVTIGSGATAVNVPKTSSDGSNYTFETETAGEGFATAFKIGIPVMKYQAYVGETITVAYTATVNSNAVTQVEKNHATLEYSNNPKDDNDKTTTPPDEETVFSAKIIINKYDGSNTSAKLSGAKFVLRCKSVTSDSTQNPKTTATAGSYYKLTGTGTESDPYKATWVAETGVDAKVTAKAAALETDLTNAATVVTTDNTGAAAFEGLENGVYELIEVKAPDGYNQIKGVAAEITVAGTNTATANIEYTADVANNAGTELPSTGGIATVKNGTVTAIYEGSCTIIATLSNGKKLTCDVTVIDRAEITKNKLSLDVGKTSSLSVTGLSGRTITWSSSDKKIATVKDGTVTAIREGTCTITATLSNGKMLTCALTVKDPAWISYTKLSMEAGETYALKVYKIGRSDFGAFVDAGGCYAGNGNLGLSLCQQG